MHPYFYGWTVNVPPPSLQFHPYENKKLIDHPNAKSKYEKPISHWRAIALPANSQLRQLAAPMLNERRACRAEAQRAKAGQAQSSPVKPNQTTLPQGFSRFRVQGSTFNVRPFHSNNTLPLKPAERPVLTVTNAN